MKKIKYFKGKVSRGFVAIFTTRIVLRISTGLLGLFLPIFLYKFFNLRIEQVFLFYFIGYFLYALVVAWACQYLNKIGLRHSLRISVMIGAIYYLLLYFLDIRSRTNLEAGFSFSFGNNVLTWLLVATVLVITVHRALYWVPLNTDMAKFTSKRNRAKQLSLLESATLVLGATMPLVAGWLLSFYEYDLLFAIAIVVYLLSLIPLHYLPRAREKYTWTYKETWKEFFSKKRRSAMLAYVGDGAEAVVGTIVWPIFIWELLNEDFFEVGLLSSLIVVVTITLQLLVGGYADKGGRRKMLHWGSSLYAIGWIIKIFIATAFHIFIVSTYHNLMKIFARTPFDALSFEKAADEGHFVDEYTAIHEMAINFGKSLMLLLAIVLVSVFKFSVEWTFILAALASLAMNFITQKYHKETERRVVE